MQRSLINFHVHPGNPGTPQSVKIVTANVRQIRKVTTACQLSLDSRGSVELFIYKSLSYQHESNVFNHRYVFFFVFFFVLGTSNFKVSARIRTHYFDSRFVLVICFSFHLPLAASLLPRPFSRDSFHSPNRRACSQATQGLENLQTFVRGRVEGG